MFRKDFLQIVFRIRNLCVGALLLATLPAGAEEVGRIVAVVNDDAISLHDLSSRLRFTLASVGMPSTEEEQDRILLDVLETLIDERLKVQAAQRLGISVTGEEMNAGFQRLAASYGHDIQNFRAVLQRQTIPETTIWQKLAADVRWAKIVQSRIVLSPDDVEAEVENIRAAEGKPEYLVRRIYLSVADDDARQRARELAGRLRDTVLEGTPFETVALRHSEGYRDAPGGDWVREDAVDEPVARVLHELEAGGVSPPVDTPGGVFLIQLLERRVVTLPEEDSELQVVAENHVFRRLAEATDRGLLRQLRSGALIDRRI